MAVTTAISIKAPPVPPNTSSWIVRVKAVKKVVCKKYEKTSMTGDHPSQIRVIASRGAKLRAEEEELMPFEEAMLMPTRPERFR